MTVIILAGGKSERMGIDKAFLRLGQRTFISKIVEEMFLVSDNVIVAIGAKSPTKFMQEINDGRVRYVNDKNCLENPLDGMLAGFDATEGEYAAVVACDLPLVRSGLISRLFDIAKGHGAAVPIWNPESEWSIEPLCAVYNVESMKKAIEDSIRKGTDGCKRVVLSLLDVCYVSVSDLRQSDPELVSFRNVNTMSDYTQILEYLAGPDPFLRANQKLLPGYSVVSQ